MTAPEWSLAGICPNNRAEQMSIELLHAELLICYVISEQWGSTGQQRGFKFAYAS